MIKPLLRFISCLIGLSGFGVIVAEVLKKWQLISKNLSPVWVIVPILILFVAKEVTNSSHITYISHYMKQVFAVCGIKLLNST